MRRLVQWMRWPSGWLFPSLPWQSPRPPFCHDGTERRIPRPKDADKQKSFSSGKKKGHSVKNVLLINALVTILFLSDTYEGRVHDKCIADETPYPRGGMVTDEQKVFNQQLARRRVRIEHVNSSVKRCRIVKDTIRLFKDGVRDMVAEICCGLHNFRVRIDPWQPMI